MTEERKEFDLGGPPAPSGGIPDEFDAMVESAIWEPGAFGSPQLSLSLKVMDPDYAGENPLAWYSMGRGDFVILDGGLRIGGDQYKENSKLDLLLGAFRKIGAPIPPGNEASIFLGLVCHWVRMPMSDASEWITGKRRSYPTKEDGTPVTMLLPVKYLGKREISVTPGGEAVEEVNDEQIGEVLMAALKEGGRPLKWPQLILVATRLKPEHRTAIVSRGQTVLQTLVDAGSIVREEDGSYTLGVEF